MQRLARPRTDADMAALADVILVINGERFASHRVVLAAASPVFAKMFTNGMRETSEREVVLRDVDTGCMRLALDFVYTSEVSLCCLDAALRLLDVAQRFQVEALHNVLVSFAHRRMCGATVCEVLLHADVWGLTELRTAAMNRLEDVFVEASRQSAFARLDVDIIEKLIQSDNLNLQGELQVFLAIAHWLEPLKRTVIFGNMAADSMAPSCPTESDVCLLRGMKSLNYMYSSDTNTLTKEERRNYAAKLLHHVKLGTMSDCDLRKVLTHESARLSNEFYRRVVDAVFRGRQTDDLAINERRWRRRGTNVQAYPRLRCTGNSSREAFRRLGFDSTQADFMTNLLESAIYRHASTHMATYNELHIRFNDALNGEQGLSLAETLWRTRSAAHFFDW